MYVLLHTPNVYISNRGAVVADSGGLCRLPSANIWLVFYVSRTFLAALMIGIRTWTPLIAIVILLITIPTSAFTFQASSSKVKCFAEDLVSGMQYAIRIKMAKSLAALTKLEIYSDKNIEYAGSAKGDETHLVTPIVSVPYRVCFAFGAHVDAASSPDVTLTFKASADVEMEKAQLKERDLVRKKAIHLENPLQQSQYIENSARTLKMHYRYLKDREEALRSTNESTCERTYVFTAFSLCLAAVVGLLWHLKLKRFLLSKKLLD